MNLLIYGADVTSPHHARAKLWLEELLSGTEPIGFAWLVLVAFLRLSTQSRVFGNPLTTEEAFGVVESWLAQPNAFIVTPTGRHLAIMRGLTEAVGIAGNLTNDAHLAALAIEHDGEGVFRRYGLRALPRSQVAQPARVKRLPPLYANRRTCYDGAPATASMDVRRACRCCHNRRYSADLG